jgi:hypothetical protein
MMDMQNPTQTTNNASPDEAGPPTCPALPLVDDDTLDTFLREPAKVGCLPVEPTGYRREFQRMIVSAFLHHGEPPRQNA